MRIDKAWASLNSMHIIWKSFFYGTYKRVLRAATTSENVQCTSYIDQLRDDTDLLTIDEIKAAMNDREGWKKYVMYYRASSTW